MRHNFKKKKIDLHFSEFIIGIQWFRKESRYVVYRLILYTNDSTAHKSYFLTQGSNVTEILIVNKETVVYSAAMYDICDID